MDDDFFQRRQDDAYRAIGRYMVEFSRLVFHMRSLISDRLHTSPSILGELVLGESAADQISNAFFGICRRVTQLDENEFKVASRLRAAVKKEIEFRNDIAHGDWWVDLARLGIVPIDTTQIIRIRPMREEEPIKAIQLTVQQLDERSDALAALRDLVAEYGAICFSLHGYADTKVGDVLVFRGTKPGEVVRDGPEASTVPFRAI